MACDDDFSGPDLALQWQWQANPQRRWYDLDGGLRLHILPCVRDQSLLWYLPNVLSQTPQAWAFTMEASLTLEDREEGDEAGIAVLGHSYSALALQRAASGRRLVLYRGAVTHPTAQGEAEEETVRAVPYPGDRVTLRLHFFQGGSVTYGYLRPDGTEEVLTGSFYAGPSSWSGARPALFARNVRNVPGGDGRFHRVRFTP